MKASILLREKAEEFRRLITLAVRILFSGGIFTLFHRIAHWYRFRIAQRRIDLEYGIETISRVPVGELRADSPNLTHAREYGPTPAYYFNAILKQLPIEYSRYVFADLGCGKGLTLILAARLGFDRVVGIEFAENVYQVALTNLRKFHRRTGLAKPIELIHGDAAEFEFPIRPLVIYLYNPFGPEVITKVLANLRKSLSEHPRECWIAYLNPEHHEVIAGYDFLATHTAQINGESRVPYAFYAHPPDLAHTSNTCQAATMLNEGLLSQRVGL